MGQSNSTSLAAVKKRFNKEHDTCQDKITDRDTYTLSGKGYRYLHGRPMPSATRDAAIQYIKVLTAKYPFQMRSLMGQALWNRFSETWCDTGDQLKSLRAI